MSDWFHPSEQTIQLRLVFPKSSSERTGEQEFFATAHPRPLHDWITAQMPPATVWPTNDPDDPKHQ